MVSYNLNLKGHKLKLTPMRNPEIKLPDVDMNGIPSKRVYTQTAQFHYENQNGEKVDKVYKLLNGKVVSKLRKTAETNNTQVVSKLEAYDIIPELYYFVEADESFRSEICNTDIAYKFVYSGGNGFRVYKAYLTSFGNDLILIAGIGSIRKQIEQIKAGKEIISQITDLKDAVPTAQADELLALIEL